MLAGIAAIPLASSLVAQDKPNVVIFFMDDMGYGDLSITGATGYSTPSIDKLANEGMLFTHFYASSPISTASRAGLLTGCYATRLGVPGAFMTDETIGLNPKEEIIPEILKPKGYQSALIGKWHLGCGEHFMPLQQGFDEYFGLPYSNDMWPVDFAGNRVTPESNLPNKLEKPPLPLYDGTKVVKELLTLDDQSQLTTMYTERAVKFIEKNKNNPFFLYFAQPMPHIPLAVSDKFKGKSEAGLFGDVMMEIDWSVEQVMKTLKKNGLDKNTLVIFTSDNGPWLTFGDHSGSAGGLREGKQTSFEGGQRVPCIMWWKGVIPPGEVNPQLASTLDILPTLCDITKANLPEEKIDGVSILSLMKGEVKSSPRKHLYYYYGNNPTKTLNNLEAVRDNRFKLVFPHTYVKNEGSRLGKGGFPGKSEKGEVGMALYDLRLDPGERFDVKDQYPQKVAELSALAEKMRQDLGDNLTKISPKNQRLVGKIQ